jgi:hypothetical protein
METSPETCADGITAKLAWAQMYRILCALADGESARLRTEDEKHFFLELMSLLARYSCDCGLMPMLNQTVIPNVSTYDHEFYTSDEDDGTRFESEEGSSLAAARAAILNQLNNIVKARQEETKLDRLSHYPS